MTREDLIGAVARGWTHPETAQKQMDSNLAYAIVDEVEELLSQEGLYLYGESDRT